VSLLIVHAAATWFMTGLIWFVQIVHYPLFAKVGALAFKEYEHDHQRKTTWVVAPVMLIEAAAASVLVMPVVGMADAMLAWLGLALLAVVWLSTFLVQVPLHAALERAPSRETMDRLVLTNWVRTVAWTARAVVAGLMLSFAR
jgi:hypothetical protein